MVNKLFFEITTTWNSKDKYEIYLEEVENILIYNQILKLKPKEIERFPLQASTGMIIQFIKDIT